MELEVSRHTLWTLGGIVLFVTFVLLGRAVTPVDGEGDVLVLSPSYVATVRYLKAAQGWLKQMDTVETGIAGVLEGEGNFYRQGEHAEGAFESAVAIVRSIDQTTSPPALTSLRVAVSGCAVAHVNAARQTLAYVSEPSDENKQTALAALEQATRSGPRAQRCRRKCGQHDEAVE